MSIQHTNNFPKLHNAMWPGLVGKGSPGAEPSINLDTMLELTAAAEVDGVKFDGVDLFLFEPHVSIDANDDALNRLADKIGSKGFVVGSVVAPVWPPTGGGSAMGSDEDRQRFIGQVRKACGIGQRLRQLGVRPYGIVRIDSASSPADWAQDPEGNQARIAETFAEACNVAEEYGERLAAEGEICWGGMHSWKRMVELLERVNRPQTLGFQADMAHTLLYILGYNAAEDAILPPDWNWSEPGRLDEALKTLTGKLRPWTIDFHVAQNDATVHGSGTHDKTGHHCLPNDPNGKLDISHHANYWLRDERGQLARAFRHICWDGCMFPNAVMMQPETWNDILSAMIAVRDANGWREDTKEGAAGRSEPAPAAEVEATSTEVEILIEPKRAIRQTPRKALKRPARKSAKKVKRKPAKRPVRKLAKKVAAKRRSGKAVRKAGSQRAKTAKKRSWKRSKTAKLAKARRHD